jgi:DNA-binding PadR family transcriptional regulator
MRRKPGRLLPLEVSILSTGIELHAAGTPSFHGFLIARELKDRERARLLTAHGTLYRALNRLQELGYLKSEWEDLETAAASSRPRRRLYTVTATGRAALIEEHRLAQPIAALRPSGATAP